MPRGKKIERTPEEILQSHLEYELKEMKRSITLGVVPLNPTRQFKVGDRVYWGAHEEVYVREVGEDNLYYLIESLRVKKERDKPGTPVWTYLPWIDVFPYMCGQDTNFTKEDRCRINMLNSGIESLLTMCYGGYAGVDFDVEYQRDHVWDIYEKVDLIESIFNNIDIGKFVFVQRHGGTPGKYYEIVDGKQRLTALKEFYEDRFTYRGYFYSQLSGMDRHKFKNHSVAYGLLENPSKRDVYETFIKLNTCGRPMDHKHIEKVQKLLSELK